MRLEYIELQVTCWVARAISTRTHVIYATYEDVVTLTSSHKGIQNLLLGLGACSRNLNEFAVKGTIRNKTLALLVYPCTQECREEQVPNGCGKNGQRVLVLVTFTRSVCRASHAELHLVLPRRNASKEFATCANAL